MIIDKPKKKKKKKKKKSQFKKYSMEHWKYSYDFNQAFKNKSNFSIEWSKRSWYTIK